MHATYKYLRKYMIFFYLLIAQPIDQLSLRLSNNFSVR